MNSEFYNDRYTFITQEEFPFNLPTYIDKYSGTAEQCLYSIQKFQTNKDTFYSGHIIINGLDEQTIKLNLENILNKAKTLKLTENNAYFLKVYHTGPADECYVDSTLIVCSSWTLPFILSNERTTNSLYGDCISHRIHMCKIPGLDFKLNHTL